MGGMRIYTRLGWSQVRGSTGMGVRKGDNLEKKFQKDSEEGDRREEEIPVRTEAFHGRRKLQMFRIIP